MSSWRQRKLQKALLHYVLYRTRGDRRHLMYAINYVIDAVSRDRATDTLMHIVNECLIFGRSPIIPLVKELLYRHRAKSR